MMYGKDRRRSVLLLGVIFILGLYVGYISRHNPGSLLFCLFYSLTLPTGDFFMLFVIFNFFQNLHF